MWFSSGGTKSVLHNDDVDNINCLFSGRKELLFIDYKRYKTKVCHLSLLCLSALKHFSCCIFFYQAHPKTA